MPIVPVPVTDASGSSRSINYRADADGFLNQIILGKKFSYVRTTVPLPPQTERVLCNVQEPCVVEQLQYVGNNVNGTQLRILMIIDGAEVSLGELRPSDGGSSGFTPVQIINNSSGLWEVLLYSDVTPQGFKFRLREPLACPEGVKITLTSTEFSVDRGVGAMAYIRSF